jgi:hypothetical protein
MPWIAGPCRIRLSRTYSWYGSPGADYTGTWYYAANVSVKQTDQRITLRIAGKPCGGQLRFAGRDIAIPGWTVRDGMLTDAQGWVDGTLPEVDRDYLQRLTDEWRGYPVGCDMPTNPRDNNFAPVAHERPVRQR